MNVLILDDEKEIADLVELYLKNENYHTYKFKAIRFFVYYRRKIN